jgi:hypothetical protein
MPKSCYFHASNFDRSFLGIATFTIAHVNEHALRDSLTPALIAARVKSFKNFIHRVLLVVLLTST